MLISGIEVFSFLKIWDTRDNVVISKCRSPSSIVTLLMSYISMLQVFAVPNSLKTHSIGNLYLYLKLLQFYTMDNTQC